MFQQLDCIALRNVKYNDRNSILTVYTRQHGRLAMLLPASASAESRRLRALCQPLCRFTCMADIRPTRDIYRMREVRAQSSCCAFRRRFSLGDPQRAAARRKPLRLSLPERRSARLSLLPGRRKFPYSVPDPSAALPRHRTRLVDLLGRGCLRYGRRHFPPEPSASQPFPPVARSRRGPLDEAHEFPHLTAVPAIENRPKPDSRPPHPILFHPLSCSRHSRLSRRAPHHLLLLKRHTFTAPAEPRFQPVCRNHTHPDRPHMP